MTMDKADRKLFTQMLLRIAAIVAVASLVILFFFQPHIFSRFFRRLLHILEPFLWGGAIAYLLNPMSSFCEKYLKKHWEKLFKKPAGKGMRAVGITLSLLIMAGILVLLIFSVLPALISSISSLVKQIPGAVNRFEEWLNSLDQGDASHEAIAYLQQITTTLTDRLQNLLQTTILPNLETYVSSITSSFMSLFNVIKNFGLGCIIACYLLGSKERFLSEARLIVFALFPEKVALWIRKEYHFTDDMFNGFIHGKLLDSLIIGIICYIFTLIAGTPYAVLVSVIIGVTNIIPFFGPYLGAIPSALFILTVSPTKCLVFLIFLFVLQQFDGNILGPAILGDSLGISAIWILFSILLFSSMWGIVGMLIGVPAFAVIYDILRSGIQQLLRMRSKEDMFLSYEENFPREQSKRARKRS